MPYLVMKVFNDTLTNDIVNFEQLGPEFFCRLYVEELDTCRKYDKMSCHTYMQWANSADYMF